MKPRADVMYLSAVSTRYLGALVVPAWLLAHSALAQPMTLELGWTVRQVAAGLFFGGNVPAYDPISTDLFVTGIGSGTPGFYGNHVYRITQLGMTTEIYSEDVSPGGTNFSYLAFDPVSRIVYFNSGGSGPTNIRKIDEFGNFIEDVAAPSRDHLTGMAFAPDGKLYLNRLQRGHNSTGIDRYNENDDTFTTVHDAVGFGLNKGLAFDRASNAYVAGDGLLKVETSGTVTRIAALDGTWGSAFGNGSAFTTTFMAGSGKIFRVAPDGSGMSLFATGHESAPDLHFGGNGRLYAVDDRSIWEYSYVPEPAAPWILPIGVLRLFRGRRRNNLSPHSASKKRWRGTPFSPMGCKGFAIISMRVRRD